MCWIFRKPVKRDDAQDKRSTFHHTPLRLHCGVDFYRAPLDHGMLSDTVYMDRGGQGIAQSVCSPSESFGAFEQRFIDLPFLEHIEHDRQAGYQATLAGRPEMSRIVARS
jgi:hypothetical protein